MSAPILESTQTSAWSSGSSVTVAKPTGLNVGNLMIFRICVDYIISISNWNGFTPIGDAYVESSGSGDIQSFIGYKIADSSDVSATDFTVTLSSSVNKMGSISRISNPDTLASNYVYTEGIATNTISPSFTGLTPTNHNDDTLLLMFFAGVNGSAGAPAISSYGIATSNPSWTEVYELSSTTGNDVTASMASATRPETTATGNFTATWSDGTTDSCGQMIAIASPWTFSTSESTTVSENYLNNVSLNNNEEVETSESYTNNRPQNITNVSKNSSNWLNQKK